MGSQRALSKSQGPWNLNKEENSLQIHWDGCGLKIVTGPQTLAELMLC